MHTEKYNISLYAKLFNNMKNKLKLILTTAIIAFIFIFSLAYVGEEIIKMF